MFDTKACPLCNKPLAVKMPLMGQIGVPKRYICSTHVPGTKIAHYHVEIGSVWLSDKPFNIQVINYPPFTVLNVSNSDKSKIYPFHWTPVTSRKMIMEIPRLDISNDVAKVVEKLKTYTVFS